MADADQPTILIIDDDPAVRQSFSDYLEDLDFCILGAENGQVGLEILDRERPALVLTDLRMPVLDGLEVIKQARKLTPDTPIIVISGASRIDDAVGALRWGAWDYLVKPVRDLSILEHMVGRCLDKARLLRENRDYQDRLEALVHERTQELEQANSHLLNTNNRLRQVVETARGLAVCTKVDILGATLLTEFAKHMVATGGSLFLVEDKGLRLTHALQPSNAASFLPFPLPERSVFNTVLTGQEPVLIRDIADQNDVTSSGGSGYRDGSLVAFPLRNETGRIVGVLTLHNKAEPPFVEQDMEIGSIIASYSCEALRTAHATEALRKSEESYRLLAENATDVIWMMNMNLQFTYISPSVLQLRGYTVDEAMAQTLTDMVAPESLAMLRPLLTQKLAMIAAGSEAGFAPTTAEAKQFRKDGSTIWTRNNVKIVQDSKGQPIGLIGVSHDITERKRAEEERAKLENQLHQSQKMESLGRLASGVAHDFNNLLTGINGYAEMILGDLEPSDPMRVDIEEIRAAGDQATALTSQLLAFSRKQLITPRVILPNEILERSQKMLRRIIGEDVELIYDPQEDLGRIKVDPAQLDQIVLNFAVNARDAMSQGGKLTIQTRNARLDAAFCENNEGVKPGDFVLLRVTDTGHGMSPETMSRVFEPFYSTKSRDQGTGLGLATVYGIVNQNQGLITLTSEQGVGSTFDVYFPRVTEQASQRPDDELSSLPSGTETILLVEDENMVRSLARRMLVRLGYRVIDANSGGTACVKSKSCEETISLLLTDVVMPNMNGRQLYEELHETRPDMKVLFMSGYTDDLIAHHGVLDEGIEFLEKPFTIETLAQKVRKALDR